MVAFAHIQFDQAALASVTLLKSVARDVVVVPSEGGTFCVGCVAPCREQLVALLALLLEEPRYRRYLRHFGIAKLVRDTDGGWLLSFLLLTGRGEYLH